MYSKSFLGVLFAVLAMFSATTACDAGSYPKNGVCTFCPIGSYALAGVKQCTQCSKGYSAPINSVSKDACYPLPKAAARSSGVNLRHSAALCDAGSAPKNGVCTFCPVGYYALAGAKQCTQCPNGYSAPSNSVSKDACYPLAKVAAARAPASNLRQAPRAAAPRATARASPSTNMRHAARATASASASSARSSAIHCDAGSAPKNGVCTFCPTGGYALAGATTCTHCPKGFWAPINSVSKDACYPL